MIDWEMVLYVAKTILGVPKRKAMKKIELLELIAKSNRVIAKSKFSKGSSPVGKGCMSDRLGDGPVCS